LACCSHSQTPPEKEAKIDSGKKHAKLRTIVDVSVYPWSLGKNKDPWTEAVILSRWEKIKISGQKKLSLVARKNKDPWTEEAILGR
jgi:hypothetical protein